MHGVVLNQLNLKKLQIMFLCVVFYLKRVLVLLLGLV